MAGVPEVKIRLIKEAYRSPLQGRNKPIPWDYLNSYCLLDKGKNQTLSFVYGFEAT